ncbi:hypothetical protein BH10BAC3_BH10BAC3_03900 [soil metagenome]
MEIKVQVPFQQLLTLVEKLTPTQKAKLRQQLKDESPGLDQKEDFMDFLISGPVYSKKDIEIIEENRKSIAEWRTKN